MGTCFIKGVSRPELLEKLYQKYWNDTATLESDLPGHAYISFKDLTELEDICAQIEVSD